MEKLTKQQAILKIKEHIKGLKKNYSKHLKEGELGAAMDLKGRIDGLELALEYVQKIKLVHAEIAPPKDHFITWQANFHRELVTEQIITPMQRIEIEKYLSNKI